MGVVFIVLVALAITSAILSRFDAPDGFASITGKFSRKNKQTAISSESNKSPDKQIAPAKSQESPPPSGEIVAAITVALAMARRAATPTALPAAPATTTGPSSWAAEGRRRAIDRASRPAR